MPISKPPYDLSADQLFRLVAGDEPSELRNYLFTPQQPLPFTPGSTAPLLVPGFRVGNNQLLVPAGARSPQPLDLIKLYITLPEYAVSPELVDVVDLADLVKELSTMGSFRERISALAILNHFVGRTADLAALSDGYAKFLEPSARERFRNLMRTAPAEPGRRFLSRQGVFAAMRESIAVHDATGPPDTRAIVSAIGLVHAVSAELFESGIGDEETLAGLPAGLTMELVRNELFNKAQDALSLLTRMYLVWTQYADQITRHPARLEPSELFREATGVDFLDWLAMAFAFWTHRSQWKGGEPLWVTAAYLSEMDPEVVKTFMAQVASGPDEVKDRLGESPGPWNVLPFQQTPLLQLEDDYLLLDEMYLLEKVSPGMYWIVHDYEKDTNGDTARRKWTQSHAEMFELYALDVVRGIAPPLLGKGKIFYTEAEVQAAYESKVCDCVVDIAPDLLLIEIVTGHVTVATRIDGRVDAFEDDTERLVLKKCGQLDEVARSILDDEELLTDAPRPDGRRVFPIVLVVGSYPVNPMTMVYIEERLRELTLLQDPRLQPLAVLDVEDLEIAAGYAESGGEVLPTLIAQWKSTDLARVSLRNYLLLTKSQPAPTSFRLELLQDTSNVMFDEMIDRLGLTPDTGEGGG